MLKEQGMAVVTWFRVAGVAAAVIAVVSCSSTESTDSFSAAVTQAVALTALSHAGDLLSRGSDLRSVRAAVVAWHAEKEAEYAAQA